jgi:glycerol-3-phosphate acyltransferase PlsX
MMKIVIDTLGGDSGFAPIVTGVAMAMEQVAELFPVLVGPEKELRAIMDQQGIASNRYEIVDASAYVRNEDAPTCVFGGAEDTTMVKAYTRLKTDPECSAMLSAGNTGALLVGSICRLGLAPGLKFPALLSALPCNGENLLCLVDCGANVECTAGDLVRFAKMGNAFAKCYCGIERPRVGLMSVGREAQKGTALTREAYELISKEDLNFIGNVEGRDLVTDYVDVIVTDGFSGNLLLKCAESVGKAAARIVERFGGGLPEMEKCREALLETFDFNSRGAATFLGPRKTVVKMHGQANADTVVASIQQVLRLERAGFSQAVAAALSK